MVRFRANSKSMGIDLTVSGVCFRQNGFSRRVCRYHFCEELGAGMRDPRRCSRHRGGDGDNGDDGDGGEGDGDDDTTAAHEHQ